MSNSEGTDPIVEIAGVSITFDRQPVLDNVSFQVQRGETRIILGPAGGGKSVLMKLVNGLLQPDRGTVSVFGKDLARLSQRDMF